MPNDPKLESYLASLERALKPLPVSDRAEIVTEIKSHALSALERDPGGSVEKILAALGEPETVANRYLMERGHSPVKPPVAPIVKWLVVGFLGAFGMSLLFAGVVIWRFSPLIQVDGKKDQVKLLGGLIDVDGEKDSLRIGNLHVSGGDSREIEGSKALAPDDHRSLSILATNAVFDLAPSDTGGFAWKCSIDKNGATPELRESPQGLILDLGALGGASCRFQLPKMHKISLAASSGKITVHKPLYDLDVDLSNGKVDLEPDPGVAYHYDLRVTNGTTGDFESSTRTEAYEVKVRLANGMIRRLGEG